MKSYLQFSQQQAGGEASSDHFCSQNYPLDPRAAGCAGGSSSPKSDGQPVTEPHNHFHRQSTPRKREGSSPLWGSSLFWPSLLSGQTGGGCSRLPGSLWLRAGPGEQGGNGAHPLWVDDSPCFSPDPSLTSSVSPSASQWGIWGDTLLLEPDAVGTCVKAPCQHPELDKLFLLVLGRINKMTEELSHSTVTSVTPPSHHTPDQVTRKAGGRAAGGELGAGKSLRSFFYFLRK